MPVTSVVVDILVINKIIIIFFMSKRSVYHQVNFLSGPFIQPTTQGWMAPRPIASSGKLNITHVYPTKRQRIQNLKTFLHNH